MLNVFELNNGFISIEVLDYGATVKSIKIPNKFGEITNVVLGYETAEEYTQRGAFFGATIGRVANRIKDGKFTLNGAKYCISKKEGQVHAMHGGVRGFDKRFWRVISNDNTQVVFKLESLDGEEGFPANLTVVVTYTLTKDNQFIIEYSAVSDGDTPISFTNHSYFNLNGQANGNVFDTKIFINSNQVVPLDKDRVAYGKITDVSGTIFDFTKLKKIGNIFNHNEHLEFGYVFDEFYPIKGSGLRHFATAIADKSGIEMQVYSDVEGIQFYTEKFLEGHQVANGTLGKGNAFCFETQRFPNAVNCPSYPPIILKKNQTYKCKTIYKFNTSII